MSVFFPSPRFVLPAQGPSASGSACVSGLRYRCDQSLLILTVSCLMFCILLVRELKLSALLLHPPPTPNRADSSSPKISWQKSKLHEQISNLHFIGFSYCLSFVEDVWLQLGASGTNGNSCGTSKTHKWRNAASFCTLIRFIFSKEGPRSDEDSLSLRRFVCVENAEDCSPRR